MSETRKVLIVQPISDIAMQLFDGRPDLQVQVLSDRSEPAIVAAAADAHAILIRDAPLPPAAVSGAPRLRVISRHGVGYDNIPVPLCTERGVPVTIIGDVNTVAVAEHTLFLMLAVAKNGALLDRAVRTGEFALRGRHTTVELRGKTLVLIGYGRIGQELAARARALGMGIAAFDPFVDRARHADVAFLDSLEEALTLGDVVSLHVPLNDQTRDLIDGAALARMKPGAILINAARGGIVDEAALAKALRAGRLHGAGLDVFLPEPPSPDNPLLGLDNVVLSPHNAALSAESLVEMGRASVRNVLAAFDGTLDRRLVVNPTVLD